MIMMMIIRRIFNYNVRENTDNNDIHESDHFHDLDLQDNDRNDDHDGTHGKNTYYAKWWYMQSWWLDICSIPLT